MWVGTHKAQNRAFSNWKSLIKINFDHFQANFCKILQTQNEHFSVPKSRPPKSVVPRIIGPQNLRSSDFVVPKFSCPKILWSQILGPQILGPKNIGPPKSSFLRFWGPRFLCPRILWPEPPLYPRASKSASRSYCPGILGGRLREKQGQMTSKLNIEPKIKLKIDIDGKFKGKML